MGLLQSKAKMLKIKSIFFHLFQKRHKVSKFIRSKNENAALIYRALNHIIVKKFIAIWILLLITLSGFSNDIASLAKTPGLVTDTSSPLKIDPPLVKDSNEIVVGGKDTIFTKPEIEASFTGGAKAWRAYLEKNANGAVAVDNGAPNGVYAVIVQFTVNKEGNISDVRPLTKYGYGMEAEVVRIITKGPAWIPATQNGKPVKAYRKQPVTFVVTGGGSKKKKNRPD